MNFSGEILNFDISIWNIRHADNYIHDYNNKINF